MEPINLAEMNPSSPPSSNSSKSMEETYQNVKTALTPITWESVLYWAEVADAFGNLTLTVLTQEEATKLWEEYAEGKTLDADGVLQPDFIEASFGLSPLEDLPYPEEP